MCEEWDMFWEHQHFVCVSRISIEPCGVENVGFWHCHYNNLCIVGTYSSVLRFCIDLFAKVSYYSIVRELIMGSSGFRKQHCRLSGKTIWKIAMEFANKQKCYNEKSSDHKRTRIKVQINKVHTINDTVKEKFNLMKKKKEEGWNEQY